MKNGLNTSYVCGIVTGILLAVLTISLLSCNEEKPNCKLDFTVSGGLDFALYIKPVGKEFTGTTYMELWCTDIQENDFPVPGLFLLLGDNSENFGKYISYQYSNDFYKTFDHYPDAERDKGKIIFFRMRTKNECGFSEFKTIRYRIGKGFE